jgi:hypothetical protein
LKVLKKVIIIFIVSQSESQVFKNFQKYFHIFIYILSTTVLEDQNGGSDSDEITHAPILNLFVMSNEAK